MREGKFTIGVDFGTDSVRAIVVDVFTGDVLATGFSEYERWKTGLFCNAQNNQFRQHPLDYLESLEETITDVLGQVSKGVRSNIVGIGVGGTGSTLAPIDRLGVPLALSQEFADNPNAMFNLWKDHTSVKEAEEITSLARTWRGPDYTKYSGGSYSSEWFWAKILRIIREDKEVREAAFSWIELCDWIPAVLTGVSNPKMIKRSRCAAGHKAMWHQEWAGLPSEDFLVQVDPLFNGLRSRLYAQTYCSDQVAGILAPEWTARWELPAGVVVSVGALDAHMGAVGGGITEKTLVKIMGTSTCDILVVPYSVMGTKFVEGISGQVDGSVIPGMIGLEAGQSAFGDVFAWFRDLLTWPLQYLDDEEIRNGLSDKILRALTEEAAKLPTDEGTVLALDWLNGRRSPFGDQELKGALMGLTLGTDAPRIFKGFVEATAFGSKAIVERILGEGIAVDRVVAQGGIPAKNHFVMQVMANVLGMSIEVATSKEPVALGAAMFAATAAGVYPSVVKAQSNMTPKHHLTFSPEYQIVEHYKVLYEKYRSVGLLLEDILRGL